MRYGRLIMMLSDHEVFSVDRVLTFAFERELLPENENEDMVTIRRRAYDALSKFSKKHFSDFGFDGMVPNRNHQFIGGWYGWRWKLAMPETYFEDRIELERLRALEEAWLDETVLGETTDRPGPVGTCVEASAVLAPFNRSEWRSWIRRGRLLPGLVSGIILFFLQVGGQIETERQVSLAKDRVAMYTAEYTDPFEASRAIRAAMMDFEDGSARVICFRAIQDLEKPDRQGTGNLSVLLRHGGFINGAP